MDVKELAGYQRFGTTELDAYRLQAFPVALKRRVLPGLLEKRRTALNRKQEVWETQDVISVLDEQLSFQDELQTKPL